MLRQDTEILPLSVSLGAFQCTPCFFILYPFSNFLLSLCSTPLPPFNPSYYWHYLRCLLQKAGHLWFLNTQEAQEANQAVTQSSGLKWTLNLKAFRAGNHVYGFPFLLDSLYTESESKVSSTEPVEINSNEERFVESKVVITHAIAFDSRGVWLIFPCLYHHSISVGTLMCMLGNNSDWPR